MTPNMVLFQNPSELEGLWTVDSFNTIYPETEALKGCAIASLATDSKGNPDTTALVTLRTFIQNGDRAKGSKKYVVGVRFCGFGDMAMIDVISLDKGFHKNIAFEHLKRQDWPMLGEEMGKPVDHFDETTRAPFVVVGGHLNVDQKNAISFSGASQDYGGTILFSDSNAIAAYVASVCGLEVIEGDKEKGKAFVSDLLEIMLQHKLKPDFYEQLIEEVFQRANDTNRVFTTQHISALMTMKAFDRAISENKSMMQTMIDELGGFARYFILASMAQKMKTAQEA